MGTIYWHMNATQGGENLHPGVNLHREQICTRVQIAHMKTAIQAWLTRNNVAWSNDLLKVELL